MRLTGEELPEPQLLRDRGLLHQRLGDVVRARADFASGLAALGDSEERLTRELRGLLAGS